MRFKLALAGDTMLGRGVAKELRTRSPKSLFSEEVVEALGEADAFVLNLECCISERGTHWSAPGKPFFFRAPPAAVEALQHLGVDCVTLANNHALDFSEPALLDTFDHLEAARIAWVGAGTDVQRARAPARLRVNGSSLTIVACSDHPDDFAAGEGQPGIAYADLSARLPQWLRRAVHAEEASLVLVMAHWGPNMVTTPRPYIRDASTALVDAGATLVAGHSAHVFHGVEGRVLYDLGDFIDDYAVDPTVRNDLGLLFFVSIEDGNPVELEALPLKLDYCFTRFAEGEDAKWIERRFTDACRDLGTEASSRNDRLLVSLR